MALADIPGQSRAVTALQAALRTGTLPHAYLLAGPAGVGKEKLALELAKALICPEKPNEGCGACAACRRVAGLGHPDVSWILPEAEQVERGFATRSDFDHVPSRELKVEQVRQLQERLSRRPLEARRKVALVLSADQLNTQAQNALLKTLEEPPADTTLLLVAVAPDRLLSTLRSRCVRLQLGALPREWVAREIGQERKLDPATAQLVAGLAEGSLTRARALDVERLAERQELFRAFQGVSGEDLRTIAAFAERYAGSREDAEATLELLTGWIHDLMLIASGSDRVLHQDLLPLATPAAAVGRQRLLRRFEQVAQARRAIARNGQPRLQLERMLLLMTEGVR